MHSAYYLLHTLTTNLATSEVQQFHKLGSCPPPASQDTTFVVAKPALSISWAYIKKSDDRRPEKKDSHFQYLSHITYILSIRALLICRPPSHDHEAAAAAAATMLIWDTIFRMHIAYNESRHHHPSRRDYKQSSLEFLLSKQLAVTAPIITI